MRKVKLNKLEIDILDKLYCRDYEENSYVINNKELNLLGKASVIPEVGYFLERLEKKRYIDLSHKALSRVDHIDNVYKSKL